MVRANIPVPCPELQYKFEELLVSPYEAIVSWEPEGPRVCQHLSPGVLLPRTRSILARRWQLWSRSSHPASFVSEPSILPVASAPGVPQSPGVAVPDGSISVEPHSEAPSDTIPPAESPAPPKWWPLADLGSTPPVGSAPRHLPR